MAPRVSVLLLLLWGLSTVPGWAQSPQTPVLRRALARATTDTTRVLLLADLSASFRYSKFDSVLWYARQGLQLAQRIGYPKGEGRCLSRIGILMSERGNLPQALRTDLKALQLHVASGDREGMARTFNQIGLLYQALDDYGPALDYYFRARRIYERDGVGDDSQLISVLTNIGATYEGQGKLDSAAHYLNRAYALTTRSRSVHSSSWGNPAPYVLRELGLLQAALGNDNRALAYYRLSAQAAIPENDLRSGCRAYQYMAELYRRRGQTDSSMYYARKALAIGQTLPFIIGVMRTSSLLADAWQARRQPDSTLHYMRIQLMAEDSLYNPQRIKQLDAIGFAEQQRLRELEDERVHLQDRLRMYGLLGGLGVVLLAAGLLWRNNRLQQQANARLLVLNEEVNQQKQELTAQRDRLSTMLRELKTAQGQLVMREKMASLGELMAGVAFEIQNPLASMKNFAGISLALAEDLRTELAKVPLEFSEQEYLREMLENLHHNQTKIVQNSQRADSIVGGMLEYARSSPGPRQATELNAFVEDYLRLTYHDARAKNRKFHAALLPRLDPAVGAVEVVRHDLGRALISLFNNAFYAVQQRQALGQENYIPQVVVTTAHTPQHIEIRVRDNGLGIPAEALPNVFERFYTTKPASEGTGLGLALSYELITKGHSGTLEVESKEGEFTEFVVRLPLHPRPKPGQPEQGQLFGGAA